ncbi:hypothetical protein SK803_32945 [Lentzea sp. BCCO 10_0856]|uniref:Uncharacterized protein n=1 Tax=Lentzea miocenica TaxID=3095431 RepID=A0ABU4TAG6_9PSEU|nr:hypothetical protein [Lentzea sp. BCCO 10_0856]MDX8035049.1 hypothetical protein [Lentzea sp. BCCO 10_0856]
MTGEQIRSRGRVSAAVGVVLVAWVVVVTALVEVETPHALVVTAVTAGLVCLCPVAGGVVATRITDAASAARLRHVFVVLEGVVLALVFPFYWSVSGVGLVEGSYGFALVLALVLLVPVIAALALVLRASHAVHQVVVAASGPIVPDSGVGGPAQRMRVLGTVLVTVGIVLSVAGVAVVFTAPSNQALLPVLGLPVLITPVLLGRLLVRVRDVYSARRRNIGWCLAVPTGCGFAVTKFVSLGGAAGMLFAGLVFAAVVLLVIALFSVREFTGVWDRPWREQQRAATR